ncbi:hypothetical protein PAHAL_3G056100 [Panicum hallii]|uniref:NB-ARC domain-containing protein n=1 Tax=Panicum hallii TaxID=206008 RepID=A0A2S3H6F7_9POAL|nr:putative disease resistance protein RGA4 [Panicum hallii]PAN16376.1 hypothetical protein PAHAL_3G056100 [Panicum hallii]
MAPAGPLVFAGKSVASSVIKEVVTKAFKYLHGYFSAENMEEMKNKIEERMPQIQAVLDVVSPDHIKDQSEALDRWFWKLRDAVEEAEDAIDELEYYELEEKAKDRKVSDWGSPFTKVKHKVVKSIKSVSVVDNTLKQFTHGDSLKRLKKAMEGLDKASASTMNFLEVVTCLKGATSGSPKQEDLMNNDRQTGSTSAVMKLFGREKEKKCILEWLTKETSVEEDEIVMSAKHIPILSLVGHGGMGKTTLVQSIYEEGDVVKDFEIIWVTVSTNFDATSVTRKILESLNRKTPKAGSLEALQQLLKDNLKSRKFLLTLDDVWEEEKRNEWEKLFAALRTGKSGSKILLTTRMASVAAVAAYVMGVGRECLTLEGLQEDENFDLFHHCVFAGLNSQSYGHLKLTGEQIARKLGGCPLVTKVVGGHLRGNMTIEFWDRFLHVGLQDFKGNADDVMKVLRLSYYNLPMELQICFRYCSIFPHGYKFTKKELVLMWIGSGLISTAGNERRRLEDIGEYCLFQLSRKSLFDQKCRIDRTSLINPRIEEYYVMHDLMHELAEYVSSGECKRITSLARIEDVKDTVRHLWIDKINSSYVEEVKKVANFKNLRTLIIGEDIFLSVYQDMKCAISSAIQNSRALRLLHLKCFDRFDFPRMAGNLKHLRYISLSQISLESIHGVLKLYHLVVLRGYCDLQLNINHVRDLANLDGLRYLYFSAGGLNEVPVNRLTSLQELNKYKVQGSDGNKISAIGNLRDLRELNVQGLENIDNNVAEKAKLKEKEYLFSLSLGWSASNGTQNRKDDLVLDQLEPNANISKLCIDGYEGLRTPFWLENLSTKKLVSLTLRNCINLEHLPSLIELVLLKHLKLYCLPKLQQIGQYSHMFSSSCMEFFLPTSLDTLVVTGCRGLKRLPILPPSLAYLYIGGVGLTKLPMIGKLCNDSTQTMSSKWLDISIVNCPCLTSLENSLLDQKQHLRAFRDVNISNCVHVETVPLTFEQMNGLRKLCIEDCPKLRMPRDARNKLLPSSLGCLHMCDSGDLELPILGSMQQLTNLSFMDLRFCSNLVSLPSVDVFQSLKSLRSIRICRCENLSSLGGLGSAPSLSWLRIIGCSCLAEARSSAMPGASASEDDSLVVSRNSLQIDRLEIDVPSLLLVEPLKSLCQTQKLYIEDASKTERLPEQWLLQNHSSIQYLMIHKAESLESLPLSMQDLSSLEQLNLFGAGQLRSLPNFPSSLQYLGIDECDSELEEKSRENGNPEWNKISHIPRVRIGNSYFILGKECSKKTYKTLRYKDYNALVSWVNQPEDDGNGVESVLHWWQKPRCLGRITS